ncbi:MAG: hypothetical protein Ct9H90mP20_1130 [Candidatus Neomarinimicrobiota bacterium]|nr:MAG: hypothetical protein Ct9H90mP20_1130 [Candidatus Neomarinimicrobiota bacterium]
MWSKESILCICFPPVRYQNVYGKDMPATKELIAHKKSIKQIKQYIGADELIYQDPLRFETFSPNWQS